jgi:hypothetical protein
MMKMLYQFGAQPPIPTMQREAASKADMVAYFGRPSAR